MGVLSICALLWSDGLSRPARNGVRALPSGISLASVLKGSGSIYTPRPAGTRSTGLTALALFIEGNDDNQARRDAGASGGAGGAVKS